MIENMGFIVSYLNSTVISKLYLVSDLKFTYPLN